MSLQLNTAYPLWFIVFCLLVGVLFAWLLYQKNKFGDDVSKRSPLYMGMTALRFLSGFLISFLLLAPFIKSSERRVQKPVIVLASDNSQSVKANKDSSYYTAEYGKQLNLLADELKNDFDVKFYTLGSKPKEGLSTAFDEKETDLSSLFTEVGSSFENQNLGAIIVASDGLYNKGANPVYAGTNLKAPVFTIALGDTTVHRDLLVRNIRNNKIAYLGNTFPVEIDAEAHKLQGNKTTLTVTKNGKTIFQKEIAVNSDDFSHTETLQLAADEAGMQHYVVQLSPQRDEISYANNRKDFFIDVLDGRNKILLLAAAPHPDLAAIKAAIESNRNYEVKIEYASTFSNYAELKNYNLALLHQLPTLEMNVSNVFSSLQNNKTPYLVIAGTQTFLSAFNDLGTGLSITNYRNSINDAQPLVNDAFSLFTLSDNTKAAIRFFPPLKSPFGNYSNTASANTLLYQQIGAVRTEQALLFFNQQLENRTGVLMGEGFWRWRLQDFERNHNHDASNELMSKIIQYLAAKNDTRKFRVLSTKNSFFENEKIAFEAEVYNESYEAITTADVKMEIKNSDGKNFSYAFSKANNSYTLDAGYFPAGNYTYKATVIVGTREETATGRFAVIPLQVELLETVADHQLMQNLAAKNGGQMVYPRDMGKLAQLIKTREDIKPVSYMQTSFRDMINLKWIFFVILTLLTAEWFLRRRNGAY